MSGMLDRNAHTLLRLRKISRELLSFKSALSRDILIIVASGSGAVELRQLFKLIRMTPTAVRLNVQSLIDDDYLELSQHMTNRRCKIVRLTDKGWALMRQYEQQVQNCLKEWSYVT
jgi:DNA-binding MarR family transcriptional regulator